MTKTDVRYILSCILLYVIVISCTKTDDVYDGTYKDQLDLVLSVGETPQFTRQGADIIQDQGQPFRGLSSILLIPFRTDGASAVVADDQPLVTVATESGVQLIGTRNCYYWDKCLLMEGTNRVLVYGRAADISGKSASALNGALETTLVDRMIPKDITFNLKSITTGEVAQQANDLAYYLTEIANTPGWSTTSDAALKGLYLDFIHSDKDGTGLIAGSARHVQAYVTALRNQLLYNSDPLSTAIMAKIDDTSLNECLNNGYPSATIGLPDGAAALRWTGSAFEVRTTTTTLDNINTITRYTYPAELCYYVNSPIYTSNEKVGKTTYEEIGNNWTTMLATYFTDIHHQVEPTTKSVAVAAPLQYGVARLQVKLPRITGTLKDANDYIIVPSSQEANFPLTGIIIGGQHTVGYDFKPMGEVSDVDARFIYDTGVGIPAADGSYTVNTLVLQSYDGEKVPIVLEFQNNSGMDFAGADGTIYKGTRFYLIARIDPENGQGGNTDATGRVFTQDYTTSMNTTYNSLSHAYSCMPDLLSPRLEIGIQVQTKWIESTPTTVIL